uniref:Acetyl-CoA synthetase-like protein n=1 Tax=Mycena chlorophos TaxID=658473 RepID=A0ABQ0L4G8_MYCCL|nr:acetyl-CoA synthetase-like protein [Mycena chlorophos]
MQLPRQDGLASTTFTPLPLDDPEGLLLPNVLHYHAKFNSDHPVFVYQDGVSGPKITLTWADAFRAFERVGRVMLRKIDGASPRTVVGVLAASDQITYLTTLGGLLLAGLVPFLISPRNSDAAIAHLLRSTECTHLLVNEADASTCKLAEAVQARMAEGRDGLTVSLLSLPSYEEIFRDDSAVVTPLPKLKVADDDVAAIMHSSGSSAFPKVVSISHRFLRETGLTPYSGEVDLAGQVLSIHAIPMFHMLGLNEFLYGVYNGMALAGFSPRSPVPKVPTGDIVLAAAQGTAATMLVYVGSRPTDHDAAEQPHRRDLWRRTSEAYIFFCSGRPEAHGSTESVGDSLAAHGAHLVHQYGSTEASGVSLVVPAQNPEEGWDWFKARTSWTNRIRPPAHCRFTALPPHEPNIRTRRPARRIPTFFPGRPPTSRQKQRELTSSQACASHTPAILDASRRFDTNDLLLQHPTNSTLWKVYGRQDDQIVHSNGEKTNPVPLGMFSSPIRARRE